MYNIYIIYLYILFLIINIYINIYLLKLSLLYNRKLNNIFSRIEDNNLK